MLTKRCAMLRSHVRAPWSPEDLGALLRADQTSKPLDRRVPAAIGERSVPTKATASHSDEPTVHVQQELEIGVRLP